MQYRILSEEMQDREVKVLMSMLVPGSVVQRIERLHDVNGIDVYFKRGVSDQELMVSFSRMKWRSASFIYRLKISDCIRFTI